MRQVAAGPRPIPTLAEVQEDPGRVEELPPHVARAYLAQLASLQPLLLLRALEMAQAKE